MASLIDRIINYRSRTKIQIDEYLEPAIFTVAANGLGVVAADKGLEWIATHTEPTQSLPIVAGYAAAAAGAYCANKFLILPAAKAIRAFHKESLQQGYTDSALSWVKTCAEVGGVIGLCMLTNFSDSINHFKEDLSALTTSRKKHARQRHPPKGKNTLTIPSKQHRKGALLDKDDLDNIKKFPRDTPMGSFLRTGRYFAIISAAEEKYGIEQGLLYALAMRESGGDPVRLNSTDDGGFGFFQLQPGIALWKDLDVFEDNNSTGKNTKYGERLRAWVKENNYDLDAIAKVDHRADVEKCTDAAADYLSNPYNNWDGDWNKALSAYNQGNPAPDPVNTKHVMAVRRLQQFALNQFKVRKVKVNESLIRPPTLKDFRFNFEGERGNGKRFSYTVVRGDSASRIAKKFDIADKEVDDTFQSIGSKNVLNDKNKFVGKRLNVGQKVFINVKLKKT